MPKKLFSNAANNTGVMVELRRKVPNFYIWSWFSARPKTARDRNPDEDEEACQFTWWRKT